MDSFNDSIINRSFGSLQVICFSKKDERRRKYFLCKCICGNIKEIRYDHLLRNEIKSCGCLLGEKLRTHGHSYDRIYRIYDGMKQRCYNSNHHSYSRYGDRGIKICDEWLDNFINFYNWSIDNGYADNLTIDRIDTNGNYEPNNCRWVTQKVQSNNKRNNHYIAYNGAIKTLQEWSEVFNINKRTLFGRLQRGWTIEEALTTPINNCGRRLSSARRTS